jgi:regulator of sirC expression with transglutaminase-like and TPR domain
MPTPPLRRFAGLMAGSDAHIDLADAALLVARQEYPDLDPGPYLRRLDAMAAALRPRLDPHGDAVGSILALNDYLFGELGFAGNRDDFRDPRNSFLNEVLDRRLGIPITLSLVYLEVGWRLGLPLRGVSFPGHFLVKLEIEDGEVILDPFLRGASLSLDDLASRIQGLAATQRPTRASLPRLLAAASNKVILLRMLHNLKQTYLEREDYPRALSTLEWILAAVPNDPREIRDRGTVYERLECAKAALADLRRYLELAPEAADAEAIRVRVVELHQAVARLN